MKIDYHVHALSHGEYTYSKERLLSFVKQARNLGFNEIGFTEHDEFLKDISVSLLDEISSLYPDIKIKLGLEVDYKPGLEQNLQTITKSLDFDYLIGSVHFIDDWGFDHPDYKYKFNEYDIDILYQNYFNLVGKAVETRMFDVVGHLDLIKLWGHRPKQKSVIDYVKPVLYSIKDADMIIEINSAGLRKPVREIYPQFEIIELMNKMDIKITFGSDAHEPNQLGLNIKDAVWLARKAGYKNVVSFTKREKIILPL